MRQSHIGLRLIAFALVAVVAAVLAGSALAGTPVTVKMSEFKFALSTKTAHAGSVTFAVTNKGKLPHNFKIAGKKTALIKPGATAKLTVTMKTGSYPYLCTVAGHAAAGMKGAFTVK